VDWKHTAQDRVYPRDLMSIGNKPSGYVKNGKLLDQVNNHQLLKDSNPWSSIKGDLITICKSCSWSYSEWHSLHMRGNATGTSLCLHLQKRNVFSGKHSTQGRRAVLRYSGSWRQSRHIHTDLQEHENIASYNLWFRHRIFPTFNQVQQFQYFIIQTNQPKLR